LGKSLFYKRLVKNIKKIGAPLSIGRSALQDPRNLSSRWVIPKTYFTPLASIDKKTLSGFDTKLALVKGP